MASALKRLASKKIAHPPGWLIENLQYEVIFGSRAFGTQRLDSDYDLYGYAIPCRRFIFPTSEGWLPGWDKDCPKFDQYQQQAIVEPDSKKEFSFNIYNIIKYFRLVADANPNMLSSLYVPEDCIKHITKTGQMVRDQRKLFLSKLCWVKYRSYSSSQLHKVTHENPVGKRKELVERYGMDTKFAMNVIRLLSECEDIFMRGDLDLRRNNEELKQILRGEWSLSRLTDEFERRKMAMEDLFHKTNLPNEPPEDKIKDLLIQCIDAHYKDLGADRILRANAETIALREIDAALNKVRNLL